MRVALHTRLKPEAIEGYLHAHTEVPAELVAAIRAAGARDWWIWRSGTELFHVLDCEDYPRLLSELAGLPVYLEWGVRMGELLEPVQPHAGPAGDEPLPLAWQLNG